VIALAIAAAAAMTGPRTHAFTEFCDELKRDVPALVCARVKSLHTGGHAVEIWQTTSHFDPGEGDDGFDDVAIYVAMRRDDGWYVSDAITSFQTFHENGHHNAGGTTSLDRLDVDAVRVGGAPAVRVKTVEGWTRFCTPCEPGPVNTLGVAVAQTTCVLDAAGPQCVSFDAPVTDGAITAGVKMSGPQTTAFAAQCVQLRLDTPGLECRRLKKLRGDHPMELWATVMPGDPDPTVLRTVQVFVAIQTNAGWFLSEPLVSTEIPATATEGSTATAWDRIDAKVVREHGRRATRIDFVHGWEQACPGCSDGEHPDHVQTTLTASCVADDTLIPHCDTSATAQ
jgi:hypothetical protein